MIMMKQTDFISGYTYKESLTMFGLINRSVVIIDLGVTDKHLFNRLSVKGLKKKKY